MNEAILPNQPVYSIGVVSEFLGVSRATVRLWEKSGVVDAPKRRGGKRFYSEYDLRRLRFVRKLVEEGLTLPAIRHFLQFYPCWHMDGCPACMSRTVNANCGKPCWKENGAYCQVSATEALCAKCHLYNSPPCSEVTVAK